MNDEIEPTQDALFRAMVLGDAATAQGLRPDEVDTDAQGGMGLLFFGAGERETRKVWVSCLNSGSTVVVLIGETGTTREQHDDPTLWSKVKTFLGR